MMRLFGFSLLEILIVISIISILATISMPMYSHHIVRVKRLEAETMLSRLAIAMEQFHLENNSYQAATLSTLHFPEQIASGRYQLMIQSANDYDYLLLAKPIGTQAENDTACGDLKLEASGVKSISGSATIEECW